ncbi:MULTISPECIES: type IV pilus biogenesis/stability protein PilW [Delftia]|jgi:type IV pilus assembly protein PilF|nr:type IV pilus biogenesis/stability protein PilW [Delftia sp. BR1]MPT03017.1 type IV pilus biogenesis/stability protein PilW [Delftia sp.]MXN28096.1 type IV pilus biogenesis/stability protein PilW [Delftia sp. CH05]PZP74506.1 MAG: type IV pilus biogenesis/stability protein PilW [Delftia acidovorans]QFS64450.1 type IV pilus biogenesis/stability protein PilW [Delftia tsuruhatensis]
MRWAVPVLVLALAGCAGKQPLVPSANSGSGNASSVSNASMASAAEVDPRRRAAIRLELAASYFQAGRIDVALEEVNQALASDPGSADGYGLLALIYMRNQDWDQADASLRKAMSLRPQDGDLQHNYGWLLCQRKQYVQAQEWLDKALAQPGYLERPKTWMAKGLCLQQAGLLVEAQQALLKGYELDAANPVIAYHLSNVMLQGGDAKRAQFYIRRLNSSPQSNAESLWLGIKIERALQQSAAMRQLADQLHQRFPESRQWLAYERGAFNE